MAKTTASVTVRRAAEEALAQAAKNAPGRVRQTVGDALETVGAKLDVAAKNPLVRGAVAYTMASEPGTAILSAMLGASSTGARAARLLPKAVTEAGKAVKKPITGPMGAFIDLVNQTGRSAAYGAGAMVPLAVAG